MTDRAEKINNEKVKLPEVSKIDKVEDILELEDQLNDAIFSALDSEEIDDDLLSSLQDQLLEVNDLHVQYNSEVEDAVS